MSRGTSRSLRFPCAAAQLSPVPVPFVFPLLQGTPCFWVIREQFLNPETEFSNLLPSPITCRPKGEQSVFRVTSGQWHCQLQDTCPGQLPHSYHPFSQRWGVALREPMRMRASRGASRAPGLLSLAGGGLDGPVPTHAKAQVALLRPSLYQQDLSLLLRLLHRPTATSDKGV